MDSGGSRGGFFIGEPVKTATAKLPPGAASTKSAQAGQKLKILANVRVSAALLPLSPPPPPLEFPCIVLLGYGHRISLS